MIPFGIILLVLTYGGFAAAIHFLLPLCYDEPCQDEGVDNSVATWMGDWFVSVAAFVFGIQLIIFNARARKSGILAQIFMAGSFALVGTAHCKYPNSGSTDNKGILEYWLVTAISSCFFALSACCHTYFSLEVTSNLTKVNLPCCAGLLVRLWLAAVILSCGTNIAGCIWCAITPSLQVGDLQDEYEDNLLFIEKKICIQMVSVSEASMWLSYALLWIPIGLLLKSATIGLPDTVFGLSTSHAAGLAVLSQWSAGGIFFVVVAFVAWIRREQAAITSGEAETFFEVWERLHGAEIFHFGILLTLYCAHNLSWSLTPRAATQRPRKQSEQRDESRDIEKAKLEDIMEDDGEESVGSGDSQVETAIGSIDSPVHLPPPADAKPAASALRHSTDAEKTVSFVEESASVEFTA